ncbi:type III-D CRISPR-associated protein Csx19 [Rhabdothermincola sp.]|uniref:type III-D CRISPR-associated protein Csx19 n=1 Tax=Rhabdothermincola sp. TaxID=2820405 RepID=UPI002FDF5AAC
MTDAVLDLQEVKPGGPVLRYHRRGADLDEALRWFTSVAGEGAALVSTPRAYLVLTVDGEGRAAGSDGTVDLRGAYEVRAFNASAELRWRATPTGGDAVLVSLGPEDPEQASIPVRATVEGGGYLLWGTVEASSAGWSRLHSGQVGTIDVPVEADPGKSVRLTTTEVVGADEHGNAMVIDELLCGWEVL